MKITKKILSFLLAIAMVFTLMPLSSQNVNAKTLDTNTFYKAFHLDCGRKYFAVDQIKAIIDTMEANDYNTLELAVGNDGLRFLLDDMTVTANNKTYTSDQVKAGIQNGNKAYHDDGTNELTQTEMDTIIAYANSKGISIIPLINTPGHMDAIITCMQQIGISNPAYSTSKRTMDVTNTEAVNFTLALVNKYIEYFSKKGCSIFNMGCDEYANDVHGNPQFQNLIDNGNYTYFVNYVNNMSQKIENAGMTPMAFNDGIYYNNNTSGGEFNTNIVISYWSSGWGGYDVASASYLAGKGHKIINTNGNWYYVLNAANGTSIDTALSRIKETPYNSVQGSGTMDVAGAMVCYWCDEPKYDYNEKEVNNVTNQISTFAASNPTIFNLNKNVDVTEDETISVVVGGTKTATISDYNFAGTYTTDDPNIATVEVTGTDATEATTTYKQASVTCNTLISNDSNNWTAVSDYYYTPDNGKNYYPLYAKRSTSNYIFFKQYTYTWGYSTTSSTNDVTQIGTQSTTDTSTTPNITVYTKSGTDGSPASTTVTFTGVAVGTTYVTIGNTRYTINVTAEDLTNVNKEIEFWITNKEVTANGATSMNINAGDSTVNTSTGASIADLVPENGSNDMVYWKSVCLDNNNKQTSEEGVDKTLSGADFAYIRYYEGKWSYSSNRIDWIDFNSDDQLVAYYLQKTTVTDEVTTQVVDWGPVKENWSDLNYLGIKYVLMDFSVKYESGEEVPSSFPTDKSIGFHCDTSSTKNGVYYRTLGMIKGVETSNYEVYMITVTPTSDTPTDTLKSTAAGNTSYSYNGTEVVAWAETQEDLDNSGLETYTSISGNYKYSIGGEPIVSGIEIYRQQGMKITYYVRAKVTEDSLSVHYIDQTANQEFYNYNIAVESGTLFDENIGLANPWKGNLANGSVINIQNNAQTVSANLSTMPAIGAQYRYSDYKCVKVERSTDGKDVYLYYTFNNAHSFVVDFGLPLNIDIGLNLGITENWRSAAVSGAKYGTTEITDNIIKYTPKSVLKGIETLQLTITDDEESVTHQIYIYPATTVYYEEGFASYTGQWNTDEISKGNGTQATQVAGKSTDEYGYDAKYSNETGISNETQATSSTKGDLSEFTFTGTGIDVYANCSSSTGNATIQLRDVDGNIKKLATVKTVATGAYGANVANGAYNTPILSIDRLEHGTYTIKIFVSNGTINIDGFKVYGTLKDEPDFYTTDKEDNPSYFEMRDSVLTTVNVNEGKDSADVYAQVYEKTEGKIDGAIVLSDATIETDSDSLLNEGPKNELYLLNGQELMFKVSTNREVQIGIKAPSGNTKYVINDTEKDINSSVDMFYTIKQKSESISDQTIIIKNTGSNVLSITKLKICDDPNATFGELTEDDIAIALGEKSEPQTADATLTVKVNNQTTVLTANGIVGETNTFAASDIQAAAESLVEDGYELKDVEYSDVTVAYGEEGTVEFTANKKESKPSSFLDKLIGFIKKIFGK